jgi:hypothetical protein
MTRYFFDTIDGERDTDDRGMELPGRDAAVVEAVRYAGVLVGDQPDLLRAAHALVITARDEAGTVVARVRVTLDEETADSAEP